MFQVGSICIFILQRILGRAPREEALSHVPPIQLGLRANSVSRTGQTFPVQISCSIAVSSSNCAAYMLKIRVDPIFWPPCLRHIDMEIKKMISLSSACYFPTFSGVDSAPPSRPTPSQTFSSREPGNQLGLFCSVLPAQRIRSL